MSEHPGHQAHTDLCEDCGTPEPAACCTLHRGHSLHEDGCIYRCPAHTRRLNCGCCEDVRFSCRLTAEHDGDHMDVTSWEGYAGVTLTVIWPR